jgi:hypothetical protein
VDADLYAYSDDHPDVYAHADTNSNANCDANADVEC